MARKTILALLPQRARLWLRALRHRYRLRRLIAHSRHVGRYASPHHAPGKLYVTLTSIPSRFDTLHLTITGLLNQSARPDGVLLWIGEEVVDKLPAKVRRLQAEGLIIRSCKDVRSFTKLVHALAAFPDAFLVSADDDIFYGPTWLETLIEGLEPDHRTIVCHRGHRVGIGEGGRLEPYALWDWDVQDDAARVASMDLLATGVGGVLYPPGALSPETTDSAIFLRICPTADDLWFFWMACRAGSPRKKVGGTFPLIQMPGSQESRLFSYNLEEGNDAQIRILERELGPPTPTGHDQPILR